MKYNHNDLPENNDSQYKLFLKCFAVCIGIIIITCCLIAAFVLIFQSC